MDNPGTVFRINPRVREVLQRDDLWVLDKPPRVLSHPNPPAGRASNAILRVNYDFRREVFLTNEESGGGPGHRRRGREGPTAHLIHRLDRETSGLILLAFRADLAAALKELFYEREVSKQYRALLRGVLKEGEGLWTDALRKRRVSGQIKVTVVGRGEHANAHTRFRVIEYYPALDATLVEFHPETGRTHQLRVQSASRGHPIAGDERYGDFTWNRSLRERIGLRRMFLHAHRIELRHPGSGRRWKLIAEPGRDLLDPLEQSRAAR